MNYCDLFIRDNHLISTAEVEVPTKSHSFVISICMHFGNFDKLTGFDLLWGGGYDKHYTKNNTILRYQGWLTIYERPRRHRREVILYSIMNNIFN